MSRVKIVFFPFFEEKVENINIDKFRKQFNSVVKFNSDLDIKTSNHIIYGKNMEGFLEEDSFTIRRLLPYGFSAFPLIVKGKIINQKQNVLLLKYRFNKIVSVIFVFLFLFSLTSLINSLKLYFFSEYFSQSKEIDFSVLLTHDIKYSSLIYLSIILLLNYELFKIRKNLHEKFII